MDDRSTTTLIDLFLFFEKIEKLAGKELGKGKNRDKQFGNSLLPIIIKTSDSIDKYENQNTVLMESWKRKTAEVFLSIESGTLSANEINDWIAEGKDLTALLLSSGIINGAGVRSSEFPTIIEIFETNVFRDMTQSTGYYAISELYYRTDPRRSYVYGMKAFQTYPRLSECIGADYVYHENSINDTIAEKCPICGSAESTSYKCIRQFLANGTPSEFSPYKLWMKCDGCGNLYAYNFPVMKMGDINGHYLRDNTESQIIPRFGLSIYSDVFNKCLEYATGKRYLEIGIGNGEMLASALEFGYDADAVEICKEDCERVSAVLDIDIKWCDFMVYESDKKYDVIVMGDVLEHISGPTEALKKACSLLDENSVLWLSTPNFNSGFTRLMKDHDPMWNQKNHYTYFSYEGLIPILNELGLTVKRYDISNRYNGSMELFLTKI